MQIIGNKKTRPSKVSEGYLYLSKSFLFINTAHLTAVSILQYQMYY